MKISNLSISLMFLISACDNDSCSIKSSSSTTGKKSNNTSNDSNINNIKFNNLQANNADNNKPKNNNNQANVNTGSNKPKNNNQANNTGSNKPENANEENYKKITDNDQKIMDNDQKFIENIKNAKLSNDILDSLKEYKNLHGDNSKVAFSKLLHEHGTEIISNMIKTKQNTAKEIKENIDFIINQGFLGDVDSFNAILPKDTISGTNIFASPFFDALFSSDVIGEHNISKKFNELFSVLMDSNIYLTSSNKDALRYLLVDRKLINEHISALFYNEEMPIFIENLVKFADGIDNFNSIIKGTNSAFTPNNPYKLNSIYDLLGKDQNDKIAYTLMKKNINFMDYPEHKNEKDFKTFNNTFENNSDKIKSILIATNDTRERYLNHHYKSDTQKNLNLAIDITNCVNFVLSDDDKKTTVEDKFNRIKNIIRDFASVNDNELDSSFFAEIKNKLIQNKKGYFNNENTVKDFLGFSSNSVGIAAKYKLENNSKSYTESI